MKISEHPNEMTNKPQNSKFTFVCFPPVSDCPGLRSSAPPPPPPPLSPSAGGKLYETIPNLLLVSVNARSSPPSIPSPDHDEPRLTPRLLPMSESTAFQTRT